MSATVDGDLLQFPQDYTFKIFAESPQGDVFHQEILAVVSEIVPTGTERVRQRDSRGGRYQCLSVVVRVHSRAQVEAIYTAVRSLKGVCYLL